MPPDISQGKLETSNYFAKRNLSVKTAFSQPTSSKPTHLRARDRAIFVVEEDEAKTDIQISPGSVQLLTATGKDEFEKTRAISGIELQEVYRAGRPFERSSSWGTPVDWPFDGITNDVDAIKARPRYVGMAIQSRQLWRPIDAPKASASKKPPHLDLQGKGKDLSEGDDEPSPNATQPQTRIKFNPEAPNFSPDAPATVAVDSYLAAEKWLHEHPRTVQSYGPEPALLKQSLRCEDFHFYPNATPVHREIHEALSPNDPAPRVYWRRNTDRESSCSGYPMTLEGCKRYHFGHINQIVRPMNLVAKEESEPSYTIPTKAVIEHLVPIRESMALPVCDEPVFAEYGLVKLPLPLWVWRELQSNGMPERIRRYAKLAFTKEYTNQAPRCTSQIPRSRGGAVAASATVPNVTAVIRRDGKRKEYCVRGCIFDKVTGSVKNIEILMGEGWSS